MQNTARPAASLCLAVCVCDVTNGAGICGRSVHDVMSQTFSALHWQTKNLHSGGALKIEAEKVLLLFHINIDGTIL